MSAFISNSRLVTSYPHKFTLSPTQVADVIVSKRNSPDYHIIFLPLEYHCRNPGYLGEKLKQVQKEVRDNRILVIVLAEDSKELKRVG